MSIPKTILVPTDFSDSADRALDYAIDLAKLTGGRVVLMHSYVMPLIGPYDGVLVPNGDVLAAIDSGARKGLADAVATRKERGVDVSVSLKNGDPRDCIMMIAKEAKADLIVMGTHGRSGFSRVLLGSVAESVVRSASVPVLTLREATND